LRDGVNCEGWRSHFIGILRNAAATRLRNQEKMVFSRRCETGFPFDTFYGRIHFLRMNYTESRWLPVVMLTCSNIFMTCAWYGHLKFKEKPLWAVILVSWGIAFFEYVLQVPANRWGNSVYSAPQLKIMQEVITLVVFAVFAMVALHVKIRWNHVAAFLCILAAVAFAVLPKNQAGGN
jgi:uncharacterized protein (DUF486 family)